MIDKRELKDGEGACEPQAAIEIFLERDARIRIRACYGAISDTATDIGQCMTIGLTDLVDRCKKLEDEAKHPPLTRDELFRLSNYLINNYEGGMPDEMIDLCARLEREKNRKETK